MTATNIDLLFDRLTKNDSNALRILFDTYYTPLCQFARLTLHSEEDAEDLVQEVFISLWNNRHALEVTHPKSWLYQAVRFRCINFIKRQKLKFTDISEQNHSLQNLSAEIPEEKSAFKSLVREAVKQLPEQNRIVFLMSRNFGYSHKEIAEKLSISTKTVENHITAAIKRIRLYLRDNKEFLLLFLTLFSKF